MSTVTNPSFLVFCGIAPHPPIMVPEVGRESIAKVRSSIEAMEEFTHRVIASGAETIVLISPHAPLDIDSFVAYGGPSISGDFANFNAPETGFSLTVDESLLSAITRTAEEENFRVSLLDENTIDHGTAVPLYFLLKHGWQGKVVVLGYSFLSNNDHLKFGKAVRQAVDHLGRRVAFIASGDLSHRLRPQAPAGYNPGAHVFDENVVNAIRDNEPRRIVEIDQDLRKIAGECGYRSILVAIGALQQSTLSCEVISYEAPFGVGYLVAQLMNNSLDIDEDEGGMAEDLPALARLAVESFVRSGTLPQLSAYQRGLLQQRAPCFVCLKTRNGELRGCIGTIEPAKPTLAEEIIANAINAATRDPRFQPVEEHELVDLRYSVDVLLPPEVTTYEDLDPRIYGVIVEDKHSSRRGLLLPDIAGVDTGRQQVQIAARKAGISATEPLRLFRFKVDRFREESD